ncbi:hypothetical protein [Amorphus coralli]|uniref:hypothetical protein n=1 Tax=Amorphus coralli TaxID=340680 RepID=UPI0003813610|nr:hypothetical protein [Amorphus coralli]
MTTLKIAAGAAAALGFLVAGAPGASANTQYEITQIQKATPSCRAHPDAPWIGRVSGSVEDDVTDFIIPVSFVGCFDSQPGCERWKEKTSGFITGPIIQYSCKPRR